MSDTRIHYRRSVSDPVGSALAQARVLRAPAATASRYLGLTDRPLCLRGLWAGEGYFGQAAERGPSLIPRDGAAFRMQMRLRSRGLLG